jgi:hypothetical protein
MDRLAESYLYVPRWLVPCCPLRTIFGLGLERRFCLLGLGQFGLDGLALEYEIARLLIRISAYQERLRARSRE